MLFTLFVLLFNLFLSGCVFASDNVVSGGYDEYNTRDFESGITSSNIVNAYIRGNITLCGSSTSSPVVVDGIACVTDFGGCITCVDVDAAVPYIVWRKNITEYGFPAGYYSRASMAYRAGKLYGATASFRSLITPGLPGFGAWVFSIQFSNGDLIWKKQISTEVYAIVTQDLLIHDDKLFVGLSSGEAAGPLVPGYVCCQFVGSIVRLKLNDGDIVWNTPFIPPALGGVGKHSGAASWGGQMIVIGKYVYTVTGQLYQHSNTTEQCLNADPTNVSCVDSAILYDSVVKIDIKNGSIVDSFRAPYADTWNIACLLTFLPGCQGPPSFDYDFTNIMYAKKAGRLVVSSKSGFVWFLDLNLNVIEVSAVTEGSASGGYVWHGALRDDKCVDNGRAYLPNNNGASKNITLPNGTIINKGAWIAYNLDNEIEWITPVPNGDTAYGSMALTNDLVLGSGRFLGQLSFMNANTGVIVKIIDTIGSMSGGAAIVGKDIIWPTGPGSLLNSALVNQKQLLIISVP